MFLALIRRAKMLIGEPCSLVKLVINDDELLMKNKYRSKIIVCIIQLTYICIKV